MSSVETTTRPIPAWLADMEFCHVDDGSGARAMCGANDDTWEECSADYDGEALCPACGWPTCPRCAQLCGLEELLEAS